MHSIRLEIDEYYVTLFIHPYNDPVKVDFVYFSIVVINIQNSLECDLINMGQPNCTHQFRQHEALAQISTSTYSLQHSLP